MWRRHDLKEGKIVQLSDWFWRNFKDRFNSLRNFTCLLQFRFWKPRPTLMASHSNNLVNQRQSMANAINPSGGRFKRCRANPPCLDHYLWFNLSRILLTTPNPHFVSPSQCAGGFSRFCSCRKFLKLLGQLGGSKTGKAVEMRLPKAPYRCLQCSPSLTG